MNTWRTRFLFSTVSAVALATAAARLAARPAAEPRIEISFTAGAHAQPVTGMVYVAISRDNQRTPIEQADTNGVPLFSRYVDALAPDAPVTLDGSDRGHPVRT